MSILSSPPDYNDNNYGKRKFCYCNGKKPKVIQITCLSQRQNPQLNEFRQRKTFAYFLEVQKSHCEGASRKHLCKKYDKSIKFIWVNECYSTTYCISLQNNINFDRRSAIFYYDQILFLFAFRIWATAKVIHAFFIRNLP